MSEKPAPLGDSSRILADVLLRFWLGGSLLIASALMVFNLALRHQDLIRGAEQLVTLVRSSLQAALPPASLEQLLDNILSDQHEERLDGVNLVLLVDQQGRITYSSRPSWRQLRIDDPLVSGSAPGDRDFQRLVRCFRAGRSDCLAIHSSDKGLQLASFSVIRPVEVQARRPSPLTRQQRLVIVNFDPGMVLARPVGDLPVILSLAGLLAGLLSLLLGSTLQGQLVPRLRDEAQTDGLTRLMTRTLFMELAKDLLVEAEESGAEMVFAILDLDHFKRINDTYGHVYGDAALAQVGELLAIVTRPQDLVCRFGGEEFALLLNGSRESGAKDLERLRLQLEMTRLNHGGHQIPLRASFGAAASSSCGYNLDYLYTCADQGLYAAKQSGRNRVGWNDGERFKRLAR